jgi:glutathione S-transferase
MKLYNSNLAPNPRRVRIYLAEKRISIPFVDVDLGRLDQKTQAYSALNPFQGAPILELDDGSVIAESIAICRYFEELNPEPPLFGVGARERAEVEMWQRRAELYLLFPIAQAYRHSHPGAKVLEKPQIGDWAESNRAKALTSMARFDAALRDRPFICGERHTVADITGLVALDFIRPARIAIPEEFVNLKRWRADLSARPSAGA